MLTEKNFAAAVEIGRALEALVKNNLCDKNLPIEVIYNKSGFAEKKVMIEDQENKGNNTDSIDSFLDKKLFEIEIGKAVDNLRKFISDEINMNIEKHFDESNSNSEKLLLRTENVSLKEIIKNLKCEISFLREEITNKNSVIDSLTTNPLMRDGIENLTIKQDLDKTPVISNTVRP